MRICEHPGWAAVSWLRDFVGSNFFLLFFSRICMRKAKRNGQHRSGPDFDTPLLRKVEKTKKWEWRLVIKWGWREETS
jgi:hypothetical protein